LHALPYISSESQYCTSERRIAVEIESDPKYSNLTNLKLPDFKIITNLNTDVGIIILYPSIFGTTPST